MTAQNSTYTRTSDVALNNNNHVQREVYPDYSKSYATYIRENIVIHTSVFS